MNDSSIKRPLPTLEEIQSLASAGNYREAETLCNVLCAEPDADARAWQVLGAIHGGNNNLVDAEFCTRKALAIDPALVTAHRNLAILLMRQERPAEAELCIGHALKLCPNDAALYHELGNSLRMQGRENNAITAFRQAIRINPRFRDAYFSLGNILLGVNDLHSAIGCMRSAYDCDNSFSEAKATEATILEVQGDYESAWYCLAPLLENKIAEPVFSLALAFASVSTHVGKELEAINYLLETVKADKSGRYNHAALYFKLGKLQERVQQYDAAFQSYSKASNLSETPNNADEFIERMHLSRRVYAKEAMALVHRTEAGGERLIFIVGMPRSGTSLIEQILSAHSGVRACGELERLPGTARDVLNEIHRGGGQGADISGLRPESAERYRRRYLDAMQVNFGSMWRLTDKLPHNFLNLGLVDLLFPGAHVIHCMRNPLDTCVSCYCNKFAGENLAYTNDLTSLGLVYKEYAGLMAYWKDTLSVPILDVQYESVVENTEQWGRQILEFCGLEWEAECLDFYLEKRQVYTLSYDQVRRPIYTTSVNRWMKFDRALGPLKEALGDLAGSG